MSVPVACHRPQAKSGVNVGITACSPQVFCNAQEQRMWCKVPARLENGDVEATDEGAKALWPCASQTLANPSQNP